LDGVVTSTSTIDDGTNPTVSDVDTIVKITSSSWGGWGWSSSSSYRSSSWVSTFSMTPSVTPIINPNDTLNIPESISTDTSSISEESIAWENPVEEAEIIYSPQRYSALPALPAFLPQTGTPLLERVQIYPSSALNTDPPNWATPSTNENLDFWKNKVLPYQEDRNAEQYIVIPSIWVVAPINSLSSDSDQYRDIVQDGTQIKDFSRQNGENYLLPLNTWVMQYPSTLPVWERDSNGNEFIGNSVIFGHSSYWKSNAWRYKTIFWLLPTLDVWEELWVYNKVDGEYVLYKYSITQSYETTPSDVGILSQDVYDTQGLTVFTCTPIGWISWRWIITSERISSQEPIENQETTLEITQKHQVMINNFFESIESKNAQQAEEVYSLLIDRIEQIFPKYEWQAYTVFLLTYIQNRAMLLLEKE